MRFLTRKRSGTFAHTGGGRWGRRAVAAAATTFFLWGAGACDSDDGDDAPAADCTKQCQAANGAHFVCRKSDGQCVSLLSDNCREVLGDDTSDDAVILGSIFTTTSDNPSAALVGVSIHNGLVMAMEEFPAEGLPPLRPGGKRRPLVFVGCDDRSEVSVAVAAAKHLAETVQVPAVLGFNNSSLLIQAARQAAVPNNTLVLGAISEANEISTLDDNNLVWRMSGRVAALSEAIAAFTPQLEQEVKQRFGVTTVKAATLYNGGAYGKDYFDTLKPLLTINGAPALSQVESGNYVDFNYGDPTDEMANPTDYGTAITRVLQAKPHIVYLLGHFETGDNILRPIEEQWAALSPQPAHRPYYIISGAASPTAVPVIGNNDDLRRRIIGAANQTITPAWEKYVQKYNARFAGDSTRPHLGGAGAYDGVFALAYLITALGELPLTGPNLAGQFARLMGGTPLETGPANLELGYQIIQSGGTLDLFGAHGYDDFNLQNGDGVQDVQFECYPRDPSTRLALPPLSSGLSYDLKTKTFKGAEGPQCQ
ncbi:MAG TPA: ABC transporter substrate-binding protein [Polyangiaceae bacterium]|nr:ABC transporter substrate-binding protein [Polyangiaceae bacterium]